MNRGRFYILGSGALALSISYMFNRAGVPSTLITRRLCEGRHDFEVRDRESCLSFSSEVLAKPINDSALSAALIVATKLYQNERNSIIIGEFEPENVFFCQNGLDLGKQGKRQLVWHGSSTLESTNKLSINHFDCFYYNTHVTDPDLAWQFRSIGGIGLDEPKFMAEQLCKFAVACTSARLAANGASIGNALKSTSVCSDCSNIIEETVSLYLQILPNIDSEQLEISKEKVLSIFDSTKNSHLSDTLKSSYTSLHIDLKSNRPTELPWLNDKVNHDAALIGLEAKYSKKALQGFAPLMSTKQQYEYFSTKDVLYE